VFLLELCCNFIDINWGTPLIVQRSYLCTKTSGDVDHPFAETAVFQNKNFIALFYNIDKGGLHTAGAAGRKGNGQLVFSIHQLLEIAFNFIHNFDEIGVHMAEGRASQRMVSRGRAAAGPCTQ